LNSTSTIIDLNPSKKKSKSLLTCRERITSLSAKMKTTSSKSTNTPPTTKSRANSRRSTNCSMKDYFDYGTRSNAVRLQYLKPKAMSVPRKPLPTKNTQ
jgi:hypothetical protein